MYILVKIYDFSVFIKVFNSIYASYCLILFQKLKMKLPEKHVNFLFKDSTYLSPKVIPVLETKEGNTFPFQQPQKQVPKKCDSEEGCWTT